MVFFLIIFSLLMSYCLLPFICFIFLYNLSPVANITWINPMLSSFFILDSFYILIFILTSFFLVFFLISLSYFVPNTFSKSFFFYDSKSYECGFSPLEISQNRQINIQYFRIALIFLIFDLELIYIFPWLTTSKFFLLSHLFNFFYIFYVLMFIIIIGIFYEYSLNILSWNRK